MKTVEVKNGKLYLDGEEIPCVKEFSIVSSPNLSIGELTMKLDVLIRQNEDESKNVFTKGKADKTSEYHCKKGE